MPRNVMLFALFSAGLLLTSIAFLGLWRIADDTQNHAYNPGATPPTMVALTAGRQYQLSTADGPDGLAARRVDTVRDACAWSAAGSAPQTLAITPVASDSRSTHVVATFVAPASGDLHIACPVWGAVWVDDANDAPIDLAGLFLLLAVITLTGGVILGLTVLYQRSAEPGGRHTPEDQAVPV
jgi:hypothetical protein